MRTLQARILPAIRALDRHCQGRRSFAWRNILIMSYGWRIASSLQLSFNFPSAGLPYVLRTPCSVRSATQSVPERLSVLYFFIPFDFLAVCFWLWLRAGGRCLSNLFPCCVFACVLCGVDLRNGLRWKYEVCIRGTGRPFCFSILFNLILSFLFIFVFASALLLLANCLFLFAFQIPSWRHTERKRNGHKHRTYPPVPTTRSQRASHG